MRWCLALLVAAAVDSPSVLGDDGVVVIHAGHLFAGENLDPAKNRSVIVRGSKIVEIRAGFVSAADVGQSSAQVIDLSDAFVLPGLIDTHVHLTTTPEPSNEERSAAGDAAELSLLAAKHSIDLLDAGFTTVMDLGTGRRNHEVAIYAVRDAIQRSIIPGPEILATGSPISAPGSSRVSRLNDRVEPLLGPQAVCTGADQCRRAVQEQVYRGADFITFYNTGSLLLPNSPAAAFTIDEMRAIVETAHTLGKVVVADGGNTPGDGSGIDRAIRVGADIIDTVTFPGQETFRLLKSRDGYFAPHVYALEAAVGDSPETLTQGTMGWLPQPVLEELLRIKKLPSSATAGHRAGVTFILAADSGVFPHGDNAREVAALVAKGLSPAEALRAATINAARAHRIDHRTGSVEPGREADIVAVRTSPLEDPRALEAILFVMTDGRVHRPNLRDGSDERH